jgi:hypothetical protein
MRILILLLLTSILLSADTQAQEKVYRSFTIQDGLPTNNIFKVRFDKKGFMWIAHDKGVSKFDGYSFKHYHSPLQRSNVYTDLYIAPDGKIWVTNIGLQAFYIENDQLILFKSFNLNYLHSTLKMGFLKNGNLIFNAEGGIFEYDIKTQKETKLTLDLNIHFFEVFNDVVYFNDPRTDKVYKFYNEKIDSINVHVGQYIIHVDNNCIISSYNTSDILEIHYGPDFKKNKIIHLPYKYNHSEKNGDFLYVYTLNNVIKIDLISNDYSYSEYINGHSYTHHSLDHLGNEWYSTLNDGIIFAPASKIVDIEPNNNDKIIKVVQFQNKVYGITYNSQLYEIVGDKTIKRADLKPYFKNVPIIVLKNLNDKYLMIGNSNFVLLDTNMYVLPYIRGMAMKDASLDNKERLYLATTGNVFYHKFNRKTVQDISKRTSFNSTDTAMHRINFLGRFICIKYDSNQNALYFGGVPGFFKQLKDQSILEIRDGQKQIFPSSLEHHNSYIIVGTVQAGVYILKDGQIIEHYSNINSTIGNNIIKVKIYNDNVWILSDKGLHNISLQNFKIQTFSYIGAVDLNNCFDFSISNNHIYLVASQKTFVANLRELKKKAPTIPLYFKYLNNGDNFFYNLKNLEFEASKNSIVVGIESPAASVLGYVEYEYSLNKKEWFKLNKGQDEIYLTQLSPGKYTLSVRQIGNNVDYQTNFTILKPFWQKWWFYLLILLLLLTLVAVFYFNRLQNLRQKTRSEIEKFKLEKALQMNVLSSIRSQMNPHFIFNALNTIQSYIYLNDKIQAINYLGKFSVLTRKILDESNKETISLSDEIETLDLYLQLEKMRFDNSLEYEIKLENINQADVIKIPPMLIQPYVENAIKHGLMNKTQNRKLSISFRYSAVDKLIIAVIDDNGIGRKRSFEINQLKKSNHQSFSTRANKTRLDILNSHRRNPISVQIIDKLDEFNNPKGTTVQINIPI